ncbi:hypothetical protein KUTeg_005902 [Tegillarca granosa]|uniref:Uncharacterized protein n=1 Tax=Tegillarca granosa TaxID=220873 RepID=A0ABQ9FLH2_TEGGR|nr:hypothetical protein KUTeg_005902 [Tegillarca granosa]
MISYKPPNYGTYIYPGYAQVIGWTVASIPIISIPVYIVIQLKHAPGTSLYEKLCVSLRPNEHWKPNKRSLHKEYESGKDGKAMVALKNQSKLIFFFNLRKLKATTENSTDTTPPPLWTTDFNEIKLEKEAFRKRKQMWKEWRKNLNIRKQNFWNTLKCEKYAETYSNWIELDAPILPRKYLIKEITGEAETETKLRRDLAIIRFRTDIAIIKNK